MSRDIFRRLMPAAALLVALAWPAHVLLADRTVSDLNCQVSALAAVSELNSDSACNLLVQPERSFAAYLPAPRPARSVSRPGTFRGRAPPLL